MEDVITVEGYLKEETMDLEGFRLEGDPYQRFFGKEYPIFEALTEKMFDLWEDTTVDAEEIIRAEIDVYRMLYSNERSDRFFQAMALREQGLALKFVLANLKEGNILDLGCGSGIKTVAYSLFKGVPVVGVDRLEEALELMRLRALRYPGVNVKGIKGEIIKLDLDQRFDNVLATCMLHESGDNCPGENYGLHEKASALYRYTSNGGKLICVLQHGGDDSVVWQLEENLDKVGFLNLRKELFAPMDSVSPCLEAVIGIRPG